MFNASRLGFTKLAAPASTAAILTFANLNTSNNNNSNSNNITLADASSSAAPTSIKLEKVKAAIANLIEEETTKRSDGTALTGTFVRLAWHCSGTYSAKDNSGGSQGGRQRFSPEANYPANAGLQIAREALEPIKLKFPELSYADLYTLAGVVAVEESGGPAIPFRLGRIDLENGESSPKDSDGRLPNADVGCRKDMIQHVRDVFWRMGFCDQEIVALLGAHALGRCHTDASGYWGPWNFSETTMSNEYFRLLIEERWSPKMTHNGEPWTGPDQYEDSTGKLMMLPSDIAMIQDPEFKKYVEMYAKDQELFFKDFAKAFSKLLELGVAFPVGGSWFKWR